MIVKNWNQTEIGSGRHTAYAWTAEPQHFEAFWPHGGNWEGVLQAMQKKPSMDLLRRAAVARRIRVQYQDAQLEMPLALDKFERGAEAVTTGHQLQVGGGPAYFHYKILSALRWAKRLQSHGIESVAVFWMATEDHDFEEISTVHRSDGDAFIWNPSNMTGHEPVGRLRWTADDERAWLAWSESFTDASTGWAENHPLGHTLSHRVRQWVNAWFPNESLIIVDGDDAELKALASPLWEAEWSGKGIGRPLSTSIERFEEAIGKAPIHSPAINLFVLDDAGQRIRADRWLENQGLVESLSHAQNSPNVALRPLYQEWLLESVAFVGGPAEVSYWMLLRDSFELHGLFTPALLLRDGGLVLDPASSEVCQHLNWSPNQGSLTGDEAVALWLKSVMAEKGDIRDAWTQWSEALDAYAHQLGPMAVPTTQAHLAKSRKELAQLEKKWRKILREMYRTQCEEMAAVFDQKICPRGEMQERILNALDLANSIGGWNEMKRLWFETLESENEPQYLVFEQS